MTAAEKALTQYESPTLLTIFLTLAHFDLFVALRGVTLAIAWCKV
jgi:hypothetical protein